MQILGHHAAGKSAPPASHYHPGIDAALDAALRKALAYHPADRHPNVRAFADELKAWLRAAGQAGPSSATTSAATASYINPPSLSTAPTPAAPASVPVAPASVTVATAPPPALRASRS